MNVRRTLAIAGTIAVVGALAACSSGGSGSDSLTGDVKGSITVLTNRTDIVNTVLAKYGKEFEKKYPGTTVKFEAITNYDQDVTTRLSSGNAGDVTLIPATVSKAELSQFFVPIGSETSMEKTYRFIPNQSYNGTAYGVPTFGSTIGFVYNKDVWDKAGVKSLPKTPDEFLSDLKSIKDKTDAIPYYTNYKDQWPLGSWDGDPAVLSSAQAGNDINHTKAPWSSTDNYVGLSDSLLFDIVHDGYAEPDPTTTAWESSKGYLATGKIGSMFLGSWAIPQMQAAATAAGKSASEIGFMPFPYQVKGTYYATLGPDYFQGIPKSSKNKATAYAWAKWFALDSGFAGVNGGVGAAKNSATPAALSDFAKLGVKYIESAAAPKGQENLQANIMKASQIDLNGGIYRQKLVDVARGAASGTKESYFASLDSAWGSAVAQYASK